MKDSMFQFIVMRGL